MSGLNNDLSNISKVLITGLTGFVGSNLQSYLKDDFLIQGISRTSSKDLISYEELDKSSFDESKAFIHLAGKAHDLKNTSDDSEYFNVNTELTKKLFNQFLDSDCEVFIYMSSVKATADEVIGVLSESNESKPVTAYGKSKLAAENYLLSKELPSSKKLFILRPCMIHGPNNKGNLNLLYSFVSKGIPYPFGKFDNERSFLSVDNLSFVIKELITNKSVESGVYNVADDDSLSTKDLVITIGETIGRKASILNIPKPIVNLIAKIGDIIPFPINSERVQKLTENYLVSNEKIKKALNKDFPLSTREGIEITIKSFNK